MSFLLRLFLIITLTANFILACQQTYDRVQPYKTNVDTTFADNRVEKTAAPMEESQYWTLVGRSLQNSHNQEEQEIFLEEELGKLSPKEMLGFRLRTDQLLFDTYTPEMWCAAYIMTGSDAEEDFEYFRNWIISRGKEVYDKAKQHPDNLADLAPAGETYDFEAFWVVGLNAFYKKTNQKPEDFLDYEHFSPQPENYPELKLNWQPNQPESLKRICPKLYAKFGNAPRKVQQDDSNSI